MGIGGNLIVILATLKYTVFSLDSITMVFVRHLAIADIFYVCLRIFPSLTVHFGRGWVLGRGICQFVANTVMISTLASMNFILTISVHRLLRCMFPLRFSLSVRNKATILALILWAYSCLGTVVSLSLNIDVYFKPGISACDIEYSGNSRTDVKTAALIGVVMQMLIPFISIILINIAMYIIAKKRFKDLSTNQALMTVSSVSGLFVASWLPSILIILMSVSKAVSPGTFLLLDKIQIHFYYLSIFGNPLLYSFVHKGFGRFARSKFSVFLRNCQNSVEAQWNNSLSRDSDHPQQDFSAEAKRENMKKSKKKKGPSSIEMADQKPSVSGEGGTAPAPPKIEEDKDCYIYQVSRVKSQESSKERRRSPTHGPNSHPKWPGAIIIWVPRSDFTGARYQKSLLRPTFFKRL
eukprot:sb/3465236/